LQGVRSSQRPSDLAVLELLAHRVRLLSIDQVGALVARKTADSARVGREWARRFELAKLVERFTVIARPPAPARHFAFWTPGRPVPDFSAVSRMLRQRAKAAEPLVVPVVRLGANGAKFFGVRAPRVPRRSETSHDLQLAEYAVLYAGMGEQLARWLSEDELAREKAYAGVVPDAELHFRSGTRIVIECGGAYSTQKLSAFHAAIAPQLEGRGALGYGIV